MLRATPDNRTIQFVRSTAIVATVPQLDYAVGIFLLVPLGDRLPHRPLITGLPATTDRADLEAHPLLEAGRPPLGG
ncbi:hypothetical protein [Streptomyces canus]|uniref:hypothetical protein n=1 Tax=Streptomyces canus TaxID=58343 RepID=UPI002B1D08BC|nr:hypothetical protein [Streptomyces canus]